MEESLKKQIVEKAAKSQDIYVLLDRARSEPRLMAELIADPDAVLAKNNMVVDPESEVYQQMRLRLVHASNLLSKSLGDLIGQFGDPGRIPGWDDDGFGPQGGAYKSLIGDEVINPAAPNRVTPGELTALKEAILQDLRAELKGGKGKG